MSNNITLNESVSIINALNGGVVPNQGIQHITVGREREINAIINNIEDVNHGHSLIKFWIGEYGSGKSFILHLIKAIALTKNFAVSTTDITPELRLYDSSGRAQSLYTKIIDNLCTQTNPNGHALNVILEKYIQTIYSQISQQYNLSLSDLRDEKNFTLIENELLKSIHQIGNLNSYEFGLVIAKYFEGYVKDDSELKKNAVRWLRGGYTTKTDAKNELGVREIINDSNYYDMIKNLVKLLKVLGYGGVIINLDEAVNLYKISQSQTRQKNYETLMSIYNDCLSGNIQHLCINIGGTRDFLENEHRGLFSYNALKTRLKGNKLEDNDLRDYHQPVIYLRPLSQEELFVLLQKIRSVFNVRYPTENTFSDEGIRKIMEILLNRPGAQDLLTPREVIREFLHILNIQQQNPGLSEQNLLAKIQPQNINNSPNDNLKNIEVI